MFFYYYNIVSVHTHPIQKQLDSMFFFKLENHDAVKEILNTTNVSGFTFAYKSYFGVFCPRHASDFELINGEPANSMLCSFHDVNSLFLLFADCHGLFY